MKFSTVIFLLFLIPINGNAQANDSKARIDSMLSLLATVSPDTAKVKLLDNIAFAYYTSDPDEGLRYAERSLQLAQKIGWAKGEGRAFNDFGNIYRHKASYPQALDYYFKALQIDESLNDKEAIGTVTGNIGTVYFNQRNYNKAETFFFRSLKAAQETRQQVNELNATGNIGLLYYQQGKYQQAFTYMQKALDLAEKSGDRRGIINQLTNIASVYSSQHNGTEANVWAMKALTIAEQVGDRQIIAINQGNIGENFLTIATDTTSKVMSPAYKADNLAKAITYLRLGMAGCREVSFNQGIIEFSQQLSQAYEAQNNYQEALKAYQQYTTLKDSIFNFENNENIASLETKRAFELKDKDIQIGKLALAKKRNERGFFMAGIGLLLGLMGIILGSFFKQKKSHGLLAKEKKRSDDLLLNILPAEIAEELKETGVAHARQYNDVSVLFTDFLNFTGTSEQLSPQDLVKELNECFTAFDAIIDRNGLEKIKTIGDAYMAVCGMPVDDATHAKKAVKAAMEIRDFIEARRTHQQAFEIRIGINSGPVVAGIIGVKKFAYDVWGDTVNTAARMEQHGESGAINISHSTYELIKNDFQCMYRGKIEAKHKGGVEMYFVIAPIAEAVVL